MKDRKQIEKNSKEKRKKTDRHSDLQKRMLATEKQCACAHICLCLFVHEMMCQRDVCSSSLRDFSRRFLSDEEDLELAKWMNISCTGKDTRRIFFSFALFFPHSDEC